MLRKLTYTVLFDNTEIDAEHIADKLQAAIRKERYIIVLDWQSIDVEVKPL